MALAPRLTALLAALLLLALVAPAASAHTSVFSADGRVRIVIGQLNEPVSTYAVSGLDVCFQENTTARAPIPSARIDHLGLTAVLRSPAGDELEQDLRAQFGKPGCYTFAEPYVLTQPGQYVVDLSGDVNGTAVAATGVNAGGAVVDRAAITFPDEGLASDLQLEQRVAALEAASESDGDKGAPAPAAALVLVGLAALALAMRARRSAR